MMKEGFQKEWKEREIPGQVLLRVRNRAWARLEKAPPTRVALHAWHLAAGLAATAILLLWFGPANEPDRGSVEPRTEPRPVPAQSTARPPAVIPPATEVKRDAPEVHPRKAERRITAVRRRPPGPAVDTAVEAAGQARRVEFNFTLPETGVRMIWILDSEFDNGGTR